MYFQQSLQSNPNNPNYNQPQQQYIQPTTSNIRPLPYNQHHDNISTINDTLISLQYRIRTLQTQIHTKIERQQSLSLFQRKANSTYVKKLIQQLYAKIQSDRQKEQKKLFKIEEEQRKKLQQLKKKLKQSHHINNTVNMNNNNNMFNNNSTNNPIISSINRIIRPQQLYLQSNQTMFSMLIDQVNSIKHNQSLIQRLIQSKHKKTIGLNNQVCRKLQSLQRQMEQMVKYVDYIASQLTLIGNIQSGGNYGNNPNNKNKHNSNKRNTENHQQQNFISYHSNNNKKPLSSHSKKLISKSQKQPNSPQYQIQSPKPVNIHYQHINNNPINNFSQAQSFQSIRLQLFSKSLQNIQKQLSQKLNIKDLLPFIKQNIPNLQEPIQQMKLYIQENFESMRKILQNQSQINQQLTKASKVAWFHCYEKYIVASETQRDQQQEGTSRRQQSLGYILFSQQLINLIPQNIQIEKTEEYTLKITTKGWYLVKLFVKQVKKDTWESKDEIQEFSAWIQVNGVTRYPLMEGGYRLLNLAQQSSIRVITQQEDIFVEIRKL